MMRYRRRDGRDDDARVLPLINIVFLLLIFFMLAGRLAVTDPFAITPPESVSEGALDVENLEVLVAVDGRLAVDGEPVDDAAFADAIATRVAEGEDVRVRLKADGGGDATLVVDVMERLRDAGIARVELLTVSTPAVASQP